MKRLFQFIALLILLTSNALATQFSDQFSQMDPVKKTTTTAWNVGTLIGFCSLGAVETVLVAVGDSIPLVAAYTSLYADIRTHNKVEYSVRDEERKLTFPGFMAGALFAGIIDIPYMIGDMADGTLDDILYGDNGKEYDRVFHYARTAYGSTQAIAENHYLSKESFCRGSWERLRIISEYKRRRDDTTTIEHYHPPDFR